MQNFFEALEKAAAICGNYSRLADELGVSRMTVHQWKTKAKPCPPEDQARIAAMLGADPREALVAAVLEKHAGTPKGEALAALFSGCEHPPPTAKKPGGALHYVKWLKNHLATNSIAKTGRLLLG